MSKAVKLLRKIVVALIGFPLLVIGVILIPLPGPGLVVVVLALVILSTEFDWTKRYLDQTKAKLRQIYDKAQSRAQRFEAADEPDRKAQHDDS